MKPRMVAMPVDPISKKPREEDHHEFKDSLNCKARACLSR